MFAARTPPPHKMKTRRDTLKELEKKSTWTKEIPIRDVQSENIEIERKVEVHLTPRPKTEGSMRSENKEQREVVCSKKSSKSSISARRKQLELEAAEAKAKIEKELIEKRLAAEIAQLEEGRSRKSRASTNMSDVNDKVEQWLERSIRDEPEQPQAARGSQHAAAAPTDIQLLTCALKDAVSSAANEVKYHELLTRISTSKDLPLFFGDPMEWLNFKQAYTESTRMCKYSDAENMWRLRKCLRGEARETVSASLISGASPGSVMDTLELRYGRPEIIISKIVSQLKKIPPLSSSHHNEIVVFSVKIKNFVTAVEALNQNDYLRSPDLTAMVLSKCPSAVITKWADYLYSYEDKCKAKLQIFSEFLLCEANKIAAAGITYIYSQSDSKKKPDEKKPHNHVYNIVEEKIPTEMNERCQFCKKSKHLLPECARFKRAMRRERWSFARTKGLCYKCLLSKHSQVACPAAPCDVDGCNQAHHRLLHWVPKKSKQENGTDSNGDVVNTVKNIDSSSVLLKIVPVTVHGPLSSVMTYALLDDGATVTLLSADVANQAGLRGESVNMHFTSAWDAGKLVCAVENVQFTVSNNAGEQFELKARKMSELNLPVQRLSEKDIKSYKHLCDKDFVYVYNGDVQPKLLIGQDNYHLIAPLECISGRKNEPYATRTQLGWCVHGRVCLMNGVTDSMLSRSNSHECTNEKCASSSLIDVVASAASVMCCTHSHNETELQQIIQQSFALDALGVTCTPRKNADEEKALAILENTSRLLNGQWEVGLPWKNDIKMPDSYPNAHRRLKCVEKKLSASDEYAERYKDRINHLFVNNYARKIHDAHTHASRTWYLPHFGVDNPNKKKLRLVFDAAAASHGYSLNDYLLQGPDLLQPLLGIMMRFREKRIAVIGDIKDMFLRVKIRPEDQDALRFLWRENPGDKVGKYCMTSLIFGANCSPFVAQFIKNKNAKSFLEKSADKQSSTLIKEAVEAIVEEHYMDDYIASYESEDKAIEIINLVIQIHKHGDFEIRNFMSNSENVLKNIPNEALNEKAVSFKVENHAERTLGLMWYPDIDALGFDLSLKHVPAEILHFKRKPTKREVLRVIMSVFDIFGILAPFTIKAKILMRATWKNKIQWDQEITNELFNLFREWVRQLKTLESLRIPRWYFVSKAEGSKLHDNLLTETTNAHIDRSTSTLELHVFCDASPAAYAAVAYYRKIEIMHNDIQSVEKVSVSFIASKSRVAPVKDVSVPRLELQAAVLGCRLARTVQSELKVKIDKRYFWTDATTVLYWIRDNTKNYKTFVANRLGEIDDLSETSEWHYIPSGENIADLATKINNYKLNNECEWITGPKFLYNNCEKWPSENKNIKDSHETNLEMNHAVYHTHLMQECNLNAALPDASRFSSWLRLLRSAAMVLLFIEKCKKTEIRQINCDLMQKAERLLLRNSQMQSFSSEINLLKSNKEIGRNSRLRTLSPFLDVYELLRVDGRIGALNTISDDVKNPVILDGKNITARLIVKYYHEQAAHGCNEMVVNELRQKYWIVNLRPTVRTVAARCVICRIRKAKPVPPRMGNLPEARMMHHQRPFTYCGIDLFGPLEVTVGRQRHKRYVVIFTCLTVRAVHLELVTTLTTDSMIMALRRMAARRGWPRVIYSDNGTNLRGADAELRKAMRELNNEDISAATVNKGVDWKFIPPGSPHMGGAWERLIRSIKTSLKVVMNERAPREEVLLTFLAEVENMVNSRPLTHVSVDPRAPAALTPNHFLLGASSNLPATGVFSDDDLYLRRQWRTAQRLGDMFWQRWLKEVLPTLLPRRKWDEETTPLRAGDLVIVVDPTMPRNTWPMGMIEKVYTGGDGRVRVVEVRTSRGTMKRPATRVALLPTEDECRESDTRAEDVEDAPHPET